MPITVSGFKKLEELRTLHLICGASEYKEEDVSLDEKAAIRAKSMVDNEIKELENEIIKELGFPEKCPPRLFLVNSIHFVYFPNSPGLKFLFFFYTESPVEIEVILDQVEPNYDNISNDIISDKIALVVNGVSYDFSPNPILPKGIVKDDLDKR